MSKTTLNYRQAEMLAVAPLPVISGGNGQFKIQIVSDKGGTKWLNITPTEFKMIETILSIT